MLNSKHMDKLKNGLSSHFCQLSLVVLTIQARLCSIIWWSLCDLFLYLSLCQIEGGFLQGYGYFTMEEKRFNQEGALTTDGPDSYKIPSAKDIPKEFNVTLLRNMRTPEDHLYSSKVINKKLSSRTQNQLWGQILKLFSFDSWNNNITVKRCILTLFV